MDHKTKTQKRAATVTINGKLYDATSGTPIDYTTHKPLPKTRQYGSFDVKPSGSVHSGPSRSHTLRRTGLVKPEPVKPRPLAARHVRTITPVATHPAVSRFGRPESAAVNAPHVVKPSEVLSALNTPDTTDTPVMLATQVQNYSAANTIAKPAKKSHKPASHKVTEHQLHHAPAHHATKTGIFKPTEADKAYSRVTRIWKKYQKRIHPTPQLVLAGAVFIVLVAGVVGYLTVPSLSLFVAAKSAGVEATYPGFVPAGYHFDGPVTYGQGKVTIKFAAAGSDSQFTIEQRATYWDSGAVLDNYVLEKSQNYLTYSQSGITVYTFGSQAAWVNAGVLHTIDGTAQLNSDQILRIAGSM
jgi:hypothetical protein